MKKQSTFDNNKETVSDNLRSLPRKQYVRAGFRIDSNKFCKFCSKVWEIKIEKSIAKFIVFIVEKLCLVIYSENKSFYIIQLHHNMLIARYRGR